MATTYHACTDCLMLIANGDTSGNERCETEQGERAYLADVAHRTEGVYLYPADWPAPYVYEMDDDDGTNPLIAAVFAGELAPGDLTFDLFGASSETWTETDHYYGTPSEGIFRHGPCDVCGSPLGGDFYPVAAI